MKIIVLGDTHGRDNWKKIVAENTFDKVVFIGDYFDSHDGISAKDQISNFEDLMDYKKANMDKVVLLIGNHDFHYLSAIHEQYSGFQRWSAFDIRILLEEALREDLLQMCFIDGDYIFTHAGVTKTWLASTQYKDGVPIDEHINTIFKERPQMFEFNMGTNYSQYGDDVCQSPIWVRPYSLTEDGIDGFAQIVGHTTVDTITIIQNKIILIDTLGTSGEFLIIQNDKIAGRYYNRANRKSVV